MAVWTLSLVLEIRPPQQPYNPEKNGMFQTLFILNAAQPQAPEPILNFLKSKWFVVPTLHLELWFCN